MMDSFHVGAALVAGDEWRVTIIADRSMQTCAEFTCRLRDVPALIDAHLTGLLAQ